MKSRMLGVILNTSSVTPPFDESASAEITRTPQLFPFVGWHSFSDEVYNK